MRSRPARLASRPGLAPALLTATLLVGCAASGAIDASVGDIAAPERSAEAGAAPEIVTSGCLGAPNGTPCDDSNPCTVDDQCSGGVCAGGARRVCGPEDSDAGADTGAAIEADAGGDAGPPGPGTLEYDPVVAALLEEVTQAELQPVVDDLSGEAPATIGGEPYVFQTRCSAAPAAIDKAEQYVYEKLQSYGLDSVAYQEFPGGGGAPAGRNVIGQIDGVTSPAEIVVLGCHLDSVNDDDYPFGRAPGADDDASGVSATLLLARLFAGLPTARTVRFCFFGAEENAPWDPSFGALYGSGYYAAQASAAAEQIVAMVQADALAYDPPETAAAIAEMHTRSPEKDPGGADRAIFELWRQAIEVYAIDLLVPTEAAEDMEWSDHGPFWQNGYPAVLLIEEEWTSSNPNWHTPSDTVATFAWPFYLQMSRSYLAVAAHLAGLQ